MIRRASLLVMALTACAVALVAWRSIAAPMPRGAEPGKPQVDVELVLAVDISYSMDPDELALQRDGYAKALTSREFMQALRQGIHGKVAVIYFEWAGASEQKIVVPWRLIDGPETADSVANEILQAPIRRAARTSISGALLFGAALFEMSGFRGIRRVIDVSGDGANNHGQLVTAARDEVVSKGITVNGLPILLKRPSYTTMDIELLDEYYEDCVIGGPGAFMVTVRDRDKFVEAIRTKLVLEIAGRRPEPRVIPAAANAPRVSCTIGERIGQERGGN
jgi:hypothetical protein